jgi:conjugative transposon TraN protein
MKTFSAAVMTGFFLFIAILNGKAQSGEAVLQTKAITPYHMAIAYSKTTNIVFPYAIVSVDRGSRDVLAQKAGGVENILQVKAAKEGFEQTNLTIITADGRLTSFLVDYAQQPSVLNLSFVAEDKGNVIALPSEGIKRKEVEDYAKQALVSRESNARIRDKAFGMRLKLDGLFIHGDVMYLRFNIRNQTNIPYDIDQLRFYIRDRKKAKRTATQELELQPILIHNGTEQVKGNAEHSIVLAVPKFTIPDRKYLAIQLMEKNGGRHLELHVKNRALMRAGALAER